MDDQRIKEIGTLLGNYRTNRRGVTSPDSAMQVALSFAPELANAIDDLLVQLKLSRESYNQCAAELQAASAKCDRLEQERDELQERLKAPAQQWFGTIRMRDIYQKACGKVADEVGMTAVADAMVVKFQELKDEQFAELKAERDTWQSDALGCHMVLAKIRDLYGLTKDWNSANWDTLPSRIEARMKGRDEDLARVHATVRQLQSERARLEKVNAELAGSLDKANAEIERLKTPVQPDESLVERLARVAYDAGKKDIEVHGGRTGRYEFLTPEGKEHELVRVRAIISELASMPVEFNGRLHSIGAELCLAKDSDETWGAYHRRIGEKARSMFAPLLAARKAIAREFAPETPKVELTNESAKEVPPGIIAAPLDKRSAEEIVATMIREAIGKERERLARILLDAVKRGEDSGTFQGEVLVAFARVVNGILDPER
jgi:cell division protein FtsB